LRVPFDPPSPEQLLSLSVRVYENLPVEGIRYQPGSELDSGWYLTTDRYTGDVDTLTHEHAHHVVLGRPELAMYLALPSGYWFSSLHISAAPVLSD